MRLGPRSFCTSVLQSHRLASLLAPFKESSKIYACRCLLILLGSFKYRSAVLQMINAKRDIHIQDFEISAIIHLHILRLVLVKTYKMRIHR